MSYWSLPRTVPYFNRAAHNNKAYDGAYSVSSTATPSPGGFLNSCYYEGKTIPVVPQEHYQLHKLPLAIEARDGSYLFIDKPADTITAVIIKGDPDTKFDETPLGTPFIAARLEPNEKDGSYEVLTMSSVNIYSNPAAITIIAQARRDAYAKMSDAEELDYRLSRIEDQLTDMSYDVRSSQFHEYPSTIVHETPLMGIFQFSLIIGLLVAILLKRR